MVGQGAEELDSSVVGVDNGPAYMETTWWFFRKLKPELLRDPEVPLLGLYPKELKAGCQ